MSGSGFILFYIRHHFMVFSRSCRSPTSSACGLSAQLAQYQYLFCLDSTASRTPCCAAGDL